MTVPEALEDWFLDAQSSIRRATWVDADTLVKNASVHVDTLKNYVARSILIDSAVRNFSIYAEDFRAAITREGFSPRHSASVEQARAATLSSLDELAHALTDAKPNELAKAMGMDWF